MSHDSVIVLRLPLPAGDWAFRVTAEDGDGNTGRAGACFTVRPDGVVVLPDEDANPQWVRDAVIYEIYLPAFTPEGTLAAAESRLPAIRSLGANVVWLMPIYENGESVNEGNAGYNIIDFYSVHPQFGTLADLDRFVRTAHSLGLRVILDSTPNHVSEKHPWVQDVLQWGDHSPFRPVVENRILGDNRGMGQSATRKDGSTVYVYYDGWSLANLNYTAVETNVLMTEMYTWWLIERNVDGFRMDVYWGPQNRYGSAAWWRPFREEIKRVKPGAFILGETDGTGTGSEANYADGGGACDAAYDWNFFNQVRQTLSGAAVGDLDLRVRNYSPSSRVNYHTGPNARYLRFLENHDETRIAQSFPAARTKAAAAVLCTAPGIPLLYAGQETGETSRRGAVDWERPGGAELTDWYTRLLSIRCRFAAFRSGDMLRVPCASARIYAFLRPDSTRPGVTVVNFSGVAVQATLNLAAVPLFSGEGEAGLYFNDLLNDTCYALTPGERTSFSLTVAPYGAAVLVLADSALSGASVREAPAPAPPGRLLKAFPNPFNSSTRFSFRVDAGLTDSVTLTLYDVLGRPVRILSMGRGASEGTVDWDGCDGTGNQAASGVYLCRLAAGDKHKTLKVVVLR
jgi:glycosidase